MSRRIKRLPGASLELAPGGSGAATEVADTSKRRLIDTDGIPAAMEPLPSMQVSVNSPGRSGYQSQPAKCAAKITRMTNIVILNHSRHVALPIQAMSNGQVRGLKGSSSPGLGSGGSTSRSYTYYVP